MPRGRGVRHKGQRRHFTSPEELEEQLKKEEREKQWREKRGDFPTDSEEESESEESEEDSAEEEEDDDEEKTPKNKGVQGLIEIENPNRVVQKTKKISALDAEVPEKTELSRKEKEEIENQKARSQYLKLHSQGKTPEAQADLARLAAIKKQREEAAKKRELEKKAKEADKAAKQAAVQKALGKKKS